jgi:hypothetical protein
VIKLDHLLCNTFFKNFVITCGFWVAGSIWGLAMEREKSRNKTENSWLSDFKQRSRDMQVHEKVDLIETENRIVVIRSWKEQEKGS